MKNKFDDQTDLKKHKSTNIFCNFDIFKYYNDNDT